MTVKLAKIFNSSSTMLAVPPPLPPPNPQMMPPFKTTNYYHAVNQVAQPQQQQQQHKSTHQHNPYAINNPTANYDVDYDDHHHGHDDDDDDGEDDDNMSIYSTNAASIMTTRDHLYNNSQRPLLADRKPTTQLLKKKTKTTINGNKNGGGSSSNNNFNNKKTIKTINTNHNHQHNNISNVHPQQQQQQQQQEHKSYISPYVQQQKRDSAKGLHGFNDFDILSQQYNQHLQSPHIGYPYGSPPSPTVNSSDFVFDATTSSTVTTTATATAATSTPRYGNITNYTTAMNITNPPTTSSIYNNRHHHHPHHLHNINTSMEHYYSHCSSGSGGSAHNSNTSTNANVSGSSSSGSNNKMTTMTMQQQQQQQQQSRFEDDFCCRTNNTNNSTNNAATTTATHIETRNGPFIFGVPPEQQSALVGRLPAGGHGISDDSRDCVIDDDICQREKYDECTQQQKQKQNLSNGHAATMQSISDTSSSSRDTTKNGAKCLLRKPKAKKKDKQQQQQQQQLNSDETTSSSNKKKNITKKQQHADKPTIKCVVVGDAAVGKTNLILSYLENRFNTEHIPTASDIYNADVMVNDSPVHLTLCDTAGQDTLNQLRELCYPDSDVFLLCFSVAKPETFHAIKTKWAPKFTKTKAALILVGTQADLRTNTNVLNKLQTNGEKPISYADAWDLATTIGAKYIETSSATQDRVKEVFDTAIWEGLIPTTLPPTPSFWKKMFCLV